jgi:diadenylate cyclase
VVSEETGAISLAFDGKLYYDLSPIEIQRKLRELLDRGARSEKADSPDTGMLEKASLDDEKDIYVER